MHDNKELFEQAVLRTSEAFGIEAGIVEKDYFVTLFLREIAKEAPTIISKAAHPCRSAISSSNGFPRTLTSISNAKPNPHRGSARD